MKTNQVSGTLFYVAAVLFDLAAIINFASADRSSGVIWLALGSTFLCLGSMYARKTKKSKNEQESAKEKNNFEGKTDENKSSSNARSGRNPD